MNRADALERWQRIANGDLRRPQYDSIDLTKWLEGIAAKVLKADAVTKPDGKPDSKKRTDAIADAIGLGGAKDSLPKLRRFLEVGEEFDDLGDDESAPKPLPNSQSKQRSPREVTLQIARDLHPELKDIPKKVAQKQIKRVVDAVQRDRKPKQRKDTDTILRNLSSGEKT